MSRPARVAIVALAFALGLALRLWHDAATPFIHDEEAHVGTDAMWLVFPLDAKTRWTFLHDHPRDHPRLQQHTGAISPWPPARPGHAALVPFVAGLAAVLGEPRAAAVVHTVRRVNAIADASTVLVLPSLLWAVGAGTGAGLLAAVLYAVFPPAVIFGSLANLQPMVAPLGVLALALAASRGATVRRAAAAGLTTALLCTTDASGVAVALAVPVLLASGAARPLVALGAWALVAAAALSVVVAPVPWMAVTARVLGWSRPLAGIAGNLRWLAAPFEWYWVGYARHAVPLAPALARVNAVTAPSVLLAAALAAVVLAVGTRWRVLVALYLPAALVLALVPPSDGVFRLHAIFPLACAGVAGALAATGGAGRAALLVPAALAALLPFLPETLDREGRIDLTRVLFLNPAHGQGMRLVAPGQAMTIDVVQGDRLSRRLWLRPGRWVLDVGASGHPVVDIDGQAVIAAKLLGASPTSGEVELHGWSHELVLTSAIGLSRFYALALRPAPPPPVDSQAGPEYVRRVASRSRHTQGLAAGAEPVIGVGWRHRRSPSGGGSLGSCLGACAGRKEVIQWRIPQR